MTIPNPVYKPGFMLTRASHAVLQVRDIAASRAFYVDTLGFVVSDADADTLWLRGLEEACHHSLVLRRGEPGCQRVGLRGLTEEDLDLAAHHFAAAGLPTQWENDIPFQGRTLRTTDPVGTRLEICATMDTRPRLFAEIEKHRGGAPQRLDHTQVITPHVQAALDFYNGMGFRLSEYVVKDGTEDLVLVFLQRKGNPHDIVFADGPATRLHHVAYTVPETLNLLLAAEHCVRNGFHKQVEFGPSRHFSPGLARFLYLRDPDGHRIELLPSHYQTIDIEDEPARWQLSEFLVGGWMEPPQSWMEQASTFVD